VPHHTSPVYQRMKRRAKGCVFAIEERGGTGKSESVYLSDVAASLVHKSAQFRRAGAGKRPSEEVGLLISCSVSPTIPPW
jgi:hypothetical protein